MEYGIILIILILLFVAFVIVQETFAQLHWRGLVEEGERRGDQGAGRYRGRALADVARAQGARRRCSGTASRPLSSSMSPTQAPA